MLIIRRELPRTRNAPLLMGNRSGGVALTQLGVDGLADRPDKPDKLTRDGDQDLLVRFTAGLKPSTPCVQALLGFPADRPDLGAQSLLPSGERPIQGRWVLMGPRRLDQDAS